MLFKTEQEYRSCIANVMIIKNTVLVKTGIHQKPVVEKEAAENEEPSVTSGYKHDAQWKITSNSRYFARKSDKDSTNLSYACKVALCKEMPREI